MMAKAEVLGHLERAIFAMTLARMMGPLPDEQVLPALVALRHDLVTDTITADEAADRMQPLGDRVQTMIEVLS